VTNTAILSFSLWCLFHKIAHKAERNQGGADEKLKPKKERATRIKGELEKALPFFILVNLPTRFVTESCDFDNF